MGKQLQKENNYEQSLMLPVTRNLWNTVWEPYQIQKTCPMFYTM